MKRKIEEGLRADQRDGLLLLFKRIRLERYGRGNVKDKGDFYYRNYKRSEDECEKE